MPSHDLLKRFQVEFENRPRASKRHQALDRALASSSNNITVAQVLGFFVTSRNHRPYLGPWGKLGKR
jgi:hypothetical protein